MKRITYHKYFGLILAAIYLVVSLLPLHLAVAEPDLDCGPHAVVSCGEHGDIHYVREHVGSFLQETYSTTERISLGAGDAPHDAQHVVEGKGRESFCRTSQVRFDTKFKERKTFQPFRRVASNTGSIKSTFIIDPRGSPLLFLSTVRLLI